MMRGRLVEFPTFGPVQLRRLAVAARALQPYVPGITKEAVEQIQKEVQPYARPHDARYREVLELAVGRFIGHFLELMADPQADSTQMLSFLRKIGRGEAREGRDLEAWQAAVRIGAGMAIARLTAQAERLELGGDLAEAGQIAQAVFAYVDRVAEVVTEGHTEAGAQAAGEREGRRRLLFEALLRPHAPIMAIAELAHRAQWPLPHSLAAIALQAKEGSGSLRPGLPPEALTGLHLPQPCALVPDPEGPGRRRVLETGLRGWVAAIGPAVDVTQASQSLHWARQALDLARDGLVDAEQPILAQDHMPLIVMRCEHDLVELVAKQRLAPLLDVRMPLRLDLAETLLALIECRFNATVVATRLGLHAQTIRYRLRKLEEMFNDQLTDPARQLELHMVLRYWTATNTKASPR